MKSDFLRIMQERGFIHQATSLEGLEALFAAQSVVAYIGFDATADSLHVGSLVQLMMLRWLQQTGHQPLLLLGGVTSLIGDPSDKNEMRQLLPEQAIELNIEGIYKAFRQFLNFKDNNNSAIVLNNKDWLASLNYIDFLRELGRHFTINRMLSFDSVRLRLEREQSLSFLEFNYMLLQAYDFYHLYRHYGCQLQMGGSEQWGNIVCGVELIRKILQRQVFGLTTPLITNALGNKMGKTVQGAVWLTADKCSPYDYWQFWRNTHDSDVVKYLRIFTVLELDEIRRLETLQGHEINAAKKVLADEATALAHGKSCLKEIHQTVGNIFETGEGELASLPLMHLQPNQLNILEALIVAQLASSRSEARRLLQGQGVRLNDVTVTAADYELLPQDFISAGKAKLSVGKKRHVLITM